MSNFKKLLDKNNGLATITDKDLSNEIARRSRIANPFPLDVFNDKVKPFISSLSKYYDIPDSFIGLTLLSAYSTAIGTSYCVTTNKRDFFYLPIWGALTGISSSGKTLILAKCYRALELIQNEFNTNWESKTSGLSVDKINQCILDTVIYREAHIPTLIKSVLPDNPKGLVKYCDELIEWINGMNQLAKKEGTDEQFWISSWNCTNYCAIRSGKQKFVVRKPFVNVIGGIQYGKLKKLFGNERDSTGFVFRLLFALPDIDKIADPDIAFEMPGDIQKANDDTLNRLYRDLPVPDSSSEPRTCVLAHEAIKGYQIWSKNKINDINAIPDKNVKELHSGIFGKIKEYALRFAAILHLADCANHAKYGQEGFTAFKIEELISVETMANALRLADYFFASALEAYDEVKLTLNAPVDVLIAATMLKRGKTFREIGEYFYGAPNDKNKVRANRQVKKWNEQYPRVFGSNT